MSTPPPAKDDRTSSRAVACLVLFVALGAASPHLAEAQRPAPSQRGRGIDLAAPSSPAAPEFGLDLGVRFTAPLALTGMMQLEMPGRIFLRSELGALPDAIAEGYADVAASLGGWDAGTRATVRDALSGALYFETALGLRIVDGLEIAVGYALLATSSRFEMSGIGGRLETTNHAIHPTLGYRVLLGDLAFLRIEAGWFHTLGSGAAVTLDQPAYEPDGLEAELAAALRARGFGPTLSLSVGLHLE